MVQIMRSDNLVLDALVVHRNGMFSIVASEHKEVLDCELLCLAPADFQASVFLTLLILQSLSV